MTAESSAPTSSASKIGEHRRHSSATQDLNEFIYSVAEEQLDAEVADDDDVFEVDTGATGADPVAGSSNTSGSGGGSELSNDVKRRTQSLGSLSGGEPKSPRKVLNCAG